MDHAQDLGFGICTFSVGLSPTTLVSSEVLCEWMLSMTCPVGLADISRYISYITIQLKKNMETWFLVDIAEPYCSAWTANLKNKQRDVK